MTCRKLKGGGHDGDPRILILEDVPTDAELVEAELRRNVGWASWPDASRQTSSSAGHWRTSCPISFSPTTRCRGSTAWRPSRLRGPGAPTCPFIFVSGTLGEELAVQAMKEGATDYVLKHRLPKIVPSVERAMREVEEQRGRRKAEAALRDTKQECLLARESQRGFFPRRAPEFRSFDIGGASYPVAEAGGDLFDHMTTACGSLLAAVGDVSGRGMPAALLMASAHAYLHALAHVGLDIAEIMARTNALLLEDCERGDYLSVILAQLDPGGRTLRYANAGHPPGFVLGSSGEPKATLESLGPPLGLFADAQFSAPREIRLESGDIVCLLTDGVTAVLIKVR